ncbi:sarcosine oxidase subunit gamma family protein [Leisingera caerulea]|uniref:sarcosine oxidase subunit gamma n=1 Tax=Leisingera caerulea TaxID=506591 RepID=UPI0021A933B9|nr:sarcosine oxidase subunit gamma family protein [Leisingera caerulea]UWQ49396.1 sarcosine oxidase subunit gamma family protein [Leisingera caerulea]
MGKFDNHGLKAISPLGGHEPRADTFTGLLIREVTDRALASLAARQGQAEAVNAAAASYLGGPLPEPASWSAAGEFAAWWMGPDLWMVSAPHDSHELLAADLKQAVGEAGSVVEQTDGWCCFGLEGVRCFDVLERLCNANVRAGTSGDAIRTSMEHLGVFLLCHEPGQRYSIIGPRSSAASLHHALVAAAKSVI